MAKTPDDHVGSGLDKPDSKGILEKLGDSVKSVLPKASPSVPKSPDGSVAGNTPEIKSK